MQENKVMLKYGKTLNDRISYLLENLSEQEKISRITSFIYLYQYSTAGSFDINEHTDFFNNVNEYSLRELDKLFYKKYNVHILEVPQKLGLQSF